MTSNFVRFQEIQKQADSEIYSSLCHLEPKKRQMSGIHIWESCSPLEYLLFIAQPVKLKAFAVLFFSLSFRPHPGEIRQIYIEKSSEALGITIKENQTKKGVFVSSVSENSLANQVGLQVRPESATYKGQLISKANFLVLIWTKKGTTLFSALRI